MKSLITLLIFLLFTSSVSAQDEYPPLEWLLQTSESVLGEPLVYPEGKPVITAAIVTMVPGQQTGWHRHDVPLFAYILEGEITVDYGPSGRRAYKADDSLVEAFQSMHNGVNSGERNVRILAVFAGSEAQSNTVATLPE